LTEEQKKQFKVLKKAKIEKKRSDKAARKNQPEKPKKIEKRSTSKGDEKFKNLFQARPKNFSIGNERIHKLDLTRFVKWPKYIRLQRQRRVLYKRLRIPPAINQFSQSASRQLAARVFKLLSKYRPEDKRTKETRLAKAAEAKLKKEQIAASKPNCVAFGMNEIVSLIEKKKASLVVIAADVDPIELVVYLPALCKKMNVPYVIIKCKGRLGQVVHQKTTCALALTEINKEDKVEYDALVQVLAAQFSDKFLESSRKWGGNELSLRTNQEIAAKLQKA
jgi:large subunit ribosomal protein L7Ae